MFHTLPRLFLIVESGSRAFAWLRKHGWKPKGGSALRTDVVRNFGNFRNFEGEGRRKSP
jgi:hypothetical protein